MTTPIEEQLAVMTDDAAFWKLKYEAAELERAYLKFQRDALLEITWLDLPDEPHESTNRWREEFQKGWARKDELAAQTERADAEKQISAELGRLNDSLTAELDAVRKEKEKFEKIANQYRELAYELVPSIDGTSGALFRFRILGNQRDDAITKATKAQARCAALEKHAAYVLRFASHWPCWCDDEMTCDACTTEATLRALLSEQKPAQEQGEAGECPECGGQTWERDGGDVQFHKPGCSLQKQDHLKGGPNAPHTVDKDWLQKYAPPFTVKGDNPPVIVAANGESILSMMWPVHAQTPEGEQAAVEYVQELASGIAEGLNKASQIDDAPCTSCGKPRSVHAKQFDHGLCDPCSGQKSD